jgi:predicted flap endonuclease-1-like 5' DNA nuclease
MSDLARVSGVGPVFARIILDAGIDGLEELADSSSDELIDRLVAANEKKGYTRADFTVKDVQYCIDMAKELPKAIEY